MITPAYQVSAALVPGADEAKLKLYQVQGITQGTDAQAEVSVRLAQGDYSVTSRGADPDTLVASAKAYIAALNKLTSDRGAKRDGARLHAHHGVA